MFFIYYSNSILNPLINLPVNCNYFEISMVITTSTAVLFSYHAPIKGSSFLVCNVTPLKKATEQTVAPG